MGVWMRALSKRCDAVWVNCVQAWVGTLIPAAYLLIMSSRGHPLWPSMSVACGLMVLGAIAQLGGASYQWSLGEIGLAVCNPLQMGVTLGASAILGLAVMRERVPARGVVAIALLSIGVIFLSLGADDANAAMAGHENSVVQPTSAKSPNIAHS